MEYLQLRVVYLLEVFYTLTTLLQVVSCQTNASVIMFNVKLWPGYAYGSSAMKQSSLAQVECISVCLRDSNCLSVNVRCLSTAEPCTCQFFSDMATGLDQLTQTQHTFYVGPGK